MRGLAACVCLSLMLGLQTLTCPTLACAGAGDYVGEWTRFGPDGTRTNVGPYALAFTPQGDVVMADAFEGTVELYSSEGAWVRTVALGGDGPGQVTLPADVDVDASGNIYVADMMRPVIQA